MRKLYSFLMVLGLALSVLLVLLCIVLGLIMDREPANVKAPVPDMASMFSGLRKVNSQLRRIARDPAGRERELSLTESEVNALTDSFFGNQFALSFLYGNRELPDFYNKTRIQLKDGLFYVVYVYDVGMNTPFGRYVNLRCRLEVSVEKSIFKWKVISCDAGVFPVPNMIVSQVLEQFLKEKYHRTPIEDVVRNGVARLKAEDGSLILRYRSKELIDSADQAFFRSGNSEIRRFLTAYSKK